MSKQRPEIFRQVKRLESEVGPDNAPTAQSLILNGIKCGVSTPIASALNSRFLLMDGDVVQNLNSYCAGGKASVRFKRLQAHSRQSIFINNLHMKYFLYLIGLVALIAITGCASDTNNGRGVYGPTYYQGYGSQDRDHGWSTNSGPNPPVNVFGPQRDYP